MEDDGKMEGLSSAAAFVKGGSQDACDDACSICLEEFCDSDPSAVTSCKHDFHLHCILEWCQRSSQCPMCWQALTLKDKISQELLEGVERERNIRVDLSCNSTVFHHPPLGTFELPDFPVTANDSDLEERIIQRLAAAAAMRRAQHAARREGTRGRSSANGHPQFLLLSTNPNTTSFNSLSASSTHGGGDNEPAIIGSTASPSASLHEAAESLRQAAHPLPNQAAEVGSSAVANMPMFSAIRSFTRQSSLDTQESAGPSDFSAFSESLKSRLTSVSMRYKDSITQSTRGWRDRFLSHNASISDFGSEVRREVSAGFATVSRMMERLDMRESPRASSVSGVQNILVHASRGSSNEVVAESHSNTLPINRNTSASCTARSGPN